MHKRCTNSACRKEFRLMPGTARCPFCGKKYPRLQTEPSVWKADRRKKTATGAERAKGWAVVLNGWHGTRRLGIVKALRSFTGAGLRDAVDALKQPTVVAKGLTWEEAEGMAMTLESLDGETALLRTGEAEKYGVPLSRAQLE